MGLQLFLFCGIMVQTSYAMLIYSTNGNPTVKKKRVPNMTKHTLVCDDLSISFEVEVFEGDIALPTNTILYISVESCGFAGNASLDIDIKEFSKFCTDLSKLYETLSGDAMIQEPFGYGQYIKFTATGLGHILISGMIRGVSEFRHELKFENVIDQTFLRKFSRELTEGYSSYSRV